MWLGFGYEDESEDPTDAWCGEAKRRMTLKRKKRNARRAAASESVRGRPQENDRAIATGERLQGTCHETNSACASSCAREKYYAASARRRTSVKRDRLASECLRAGSVHRPQAAEDLRDLGASPARNAAARRCQRPVSVRS